MTQINRTSPDLKVVSAQSARWMAPDVPAADQGVRDALNKAYGTVSEDFIPDEFVRLLSHIH